MFHSMSNNNKCPEWLSWLLHTHVPPKKVIWRLSSPHLIHISNYHTLLECEVKWALESITTNKASGGDKIPAELFQILKDDAVKVLHLTYQQIWKTQQWPQDWKSQFSFYSQIRAMPKNVQTTYNRYSPWGGKELNTT